MDKIDVFARVRKAAKEYGSQKAFAEACGVTPQYMNDVLNSRRDPSDKILAVIGIERVVVYRPRRDH